MHYRDNNTNRHKNQAQYKTSAEKPGNVNYAG